MEPRTKTEAELTREQEADKSWRTGSTNPRAASRYSPDYLMIEEKVLVDVGDVLELPEGATILTVAKDLYHGPIEVLVSVRATEETKYDGPFVKINKTPEAVKRDAEAKVATEKAAKKQQKAIEDQVAAEEAAKAAADPDYVKPARKVDPDYGKPVPPGGENLRPGQLPSKPEPPKPEPPKVNPLEKDKR